MDHVINVGTDLNDRKIVCSIPDTTEITELKYIAKVNDSNYIAENKMTVEGQTGECSVGYYHYDDTINIFYLRNSSGIVTNLTNFKLPDDFGVCTEIDDTAVLYNYLKRNCHEKVYVICEDFCKEESMNKAQIEALTAKLSGVPENAIVGFTGTTIPEGYDLIDEPLDLGNIVVDNIKSKNIFDKYSVLNGYELVNSNGNVSPNSGWFVSDYIEVEPNKSYYLSGNRTYGSTNAFYDENKNYIGYASGIKGLINTPANAKYMRFNGRLSELNNNIQLEKGTVATDYVEHKEFGHNSDITTVIQSDISSKKTSIVSSVTRAIISHCGNIYHINIVCTISSSGALFTTDLRPSFTTELSVTTSKGKNVRAVLNANGNIEIATLSAYPDDLYINGVVIIPPSATSTASEEGD